MTSDHNYFVYIMTNERNNVLYVGVTRDLIKRVGEHRGKKDPKSFTAKYNVTKLVYFKRFDHVDAAITREKQLKAGAKEEEDCSNRVRESCMEGYGGETLTCCHCNDRCTPTHGIASSALIVMRASSQ